MSNLWIDVDSEFIGGEDGDEDDFENLEGDNWKITRLPAKYIVCPTCNGRGQTSNYLGAFTGEQLDELGDEWRADYFSGAYDRPCEECNGQRVVLVPDKESPDFDQAIFDRWMEIEQGKYEDEQIRRMEQSYEYGGF